jgi:hypothetical protein
MITLLSCLYVLASAAFAWAALHRFSWRLLAAAGLAAVCGLEEQHWFLPIMADVSAWPATNITGILAAAWAGLDGPTTFDRLVVVALGRLAVVLIVFYVVVFVVQRGAGVRQKLNAQPVTVQAAVLVWIGAFFVATLIDVFAPGAHGVAVLFRVVAALGAAALAGQVVRQMITQPPTGAHAPDQAKSSSFSPPPRV